MRLTFKMSPAPHLAISATIAESKTLRTFPMRLGYTPPGWCIPLTHLVGHIDLILASPVPLTDAQLDNLNRLRAKCVKAMDNDLHAAIFLASDAEEEGWSFVTTQAHEYVHLQLLHAIYANGKAEQIKMQLTYLAHAFKPYLAEYLHRFPPTMAAEEFLADLVAVQTQAKHSNTSTKNAVKRVGRGEKGLTRAIKDGLDGIAVFTTILGTLK